MKRAKPKRSIGCSRSLLCVVAAILGIVYWTVVGSLLQHHSSYHHPDNHSNDPQHSPPQTTNSPPPPSKLKLSRFEAPSVGGVLRSTRTEKPLPPPPQGECAINLFGLPRSFKDHVLPSLLQNVVSVNEKYRCDYFVHFFNVTAEQSDQASRGGNTGGTIHAQDIYLLKDYLHNHDAAASKGISNGSQPAPIRVEIVADTDAEFAQARKDAMDEIVHSTNGDQSINPYFVQEASFTETTLVNILKMWHSQDRVWNLMEKSEKHHRRQKRQAGNTKLKIHYKRVAMLRLDVIYTTPIDIYKVPKEKIPADYNDKYLTKLRNVRGRKPPKYFFDYRDAKDNEDYNESRQHCVLPGFKSYPVNDRFFVGPYRAVKIWAKDRFSRAREHVHTVLPKLEAQRVEAMDAAARAKEAQAKSWGGVVKLTEYGLHDERFVAHSLLPAIRELTPTTEIHVDRDLYFVRVRADGAIWLKDKPGFGRLSKTVLEEALGRECTGDVYEVLDPVLGDKGPGRWQIKCPPVMTDDGGIFMDKSTPAPTDMDK